MLKEIFFAVAKTAVDKIPGGSNLIKDTIAVAAGETAANATEKAAEKAGVLKESKYGGHMLKIPFLKTRDDKIEKIFAENPDRQKLCFHYTVITDKIDFYDPDGNIIYNIRKGNLNLRHLQLFQSDQIVGRIDRKLTMHLNPFLNEQNYAVCFNGVNSMVRVTNMNAKIDWLSWSLKHISNKGYTIIDNFEHEIGQIHVLGITNFVLDYPPAVDPVALILAFMAIQIRREYDRIH